MKSYFNIVSVLATAVIFFFTACSPEQSVTPKSGADSPNLASYGSAGNDTHPQPNPPCGAGMDIGLVDANGIKNYPVNSLPYGTVSLRNDDNVVWIGITLNPSLFTDLSAWYIGAATNAPVDGNGDFDVESFPYQDDFPYANVWAWSTPAAGYGTCQSWVVYIEAFQVSFFGGPNEATRVGLWGGGASVNNGYTFEFCKDPCTTTAPCTEEHRTADQCTWGECNGSNWFSYYRDQNFAQAFPNGISMGCGSSGNLINLTSASAINNFLPSQGVAAPVSGQVVNPNGTVDPNSRWDFCRSVTVPDCPYIIDFDTDPNGNPIPAGANMTNQYAEWGVHITADNNHSGHPDKAITFNSDNPTGGDRDLGTPNQAFGGPGRGSGGNSLNGRNDVAEHNLLILAENDRDLNNDGLVDNPDDEARGGSIIFTFDNPVDIESVTFIDLDDGTQQSVTACINTVSMQQVSVTLPDYGDNSRGEVLIGAENVLGLTIRYKGSGAIAKIKFCPSYEDPGDNACFNTGNGYGNTFAGNLAAAMLNAGFDEWDNTFSPSAYLLKDLEVRVGPFAGKSVEEVIEISNEVLGGCSNQFTPQECSEALKNINQSFDGGNFYQVGRFLICPGSN